MAALLATVVVQGVRVLVDGGYGLGYDERLMSAIARSGAGTEATRRRSVGPLIAAARLLLANLMTRDRAGATPDLRSLAERAGVLA